MTKAEEEYLRSLGQSQDDSFDLPGKAQAAVDRVDTAMAYDPKIQMLEMQAQGLNPIPGYQAPQTSPVQASQPSGLGQGLSNAFSSLGQGLSSGLDAITPSQDTLHRIFMGLEAGGSTGTPLYLQERQLYQQAQLRRDAILQQLEQQKIQKQQKDEDQALAIWSNPNLSVANKKKLSQELGRNGSAMALNLARLGDEQLIAELETLKKYLPEGKVEELTQIMRQPNADLAPVEMNIQFARDRKKASQENEFKSQRFSQLLKQHEQTPFSPDSPEFDELKQYVQERTKRQEEAQKLALDIDRLKQMTPLEVSGKKLELGQKGAPIVSGHFTLPSGESAHIITDPKTGQERQVSGIPMNRQQTQDLDPKFTPEQAGRVAAMNTTLNNIADLRDALIKPGVDKDGKQTLTVDRRVLATSMLGGLPFTEGRDIERYIQDAIETKLRLQTGAAANKEEVIKEAAKFKPGQFDSDATIIGKFDKLESYMQDAFNVLDPSGVVRARLGEAGSNIGAPPVPFDTAYEDLKKKRPNWTEKEIYKELQRRGVRP